MLSHIGYHDGIVIKSSGNTLYHLTHGQLGFIRGEFSSNHPVVLYAIAGVEFFQPFCMFIFVYFFGKQRQGLFHSSQQGHIGMDDFVDFCRVNFQMDDPGVGGILLRICCDPVIEAQPDAKDKVCFIGFDIGTVIAMHAQHSHIQRVISGHG